MTTLRALVASRAAKVAGLVVGLVVIVLLLLRLRTLWRDHPVPLDHASRPLLVVAVVAAAIAMTAYALVWPAALRAAGGEPRGWMLVPFYAGQLGKYLPGGAWQYVGRAGLIMRDGVAAGPAGGSLLLEALASAAAAALLAPLAAGSRGVVVGVVAAVAVVVAARSSLLARLVARVRGLGGLDLRALPLLVGRYLAVWVMFGVAFWVTARALYAVPYSDLGLYTGVFAASWVAGFVVVFAPGGLGVREAVIVVLLRGRLGEAEAIVLATASRIAFTLVDLIGGVPALLAARRGR